MGDVAEASKCGSQNSSKVNRAMEAIREIFHE
jgi:hypothetical protein